jgi:hypothetical protein
VWVCALAVVATHAQTKPAPKPAPTPATPRPQTQKPTAKPGTAKPATAKPTPEPPKPAAPPAPQDVRYKAVYVNGDQKSEGVAFAKGDRERFEFEDMVLLRQHDQKRTVQISRSANTYLVTPEDSVVPRAQSPTTTPSPTPGIATVVTTIEDTGERKALFGQQARHVRTTIEKQGPPTGCDPTKQTIKTDGWYIDPPKVLASQPSTESAEATTTCVDQIKATVNGDPKALGFPVAYTTTVTGPDGKAVVTSMEVTEFEQTTLDPSLFDVPQGMTAAANLTDLSKALSDSNEARLVAANDAPPPAAPAAPAPGSALRVAVVEPTNKTDQQVDTRTLRARIISSLAAQKVDAAPLTGRSQAELQKRAAERGFDFLLLTELTELKTSKPGLLGRLPGSGSKPSIEASLSTRLLQASDGKARLTTTAKGKEGGFNWKGTLKTAGNAYMTMYMAPAMLLHMNGLGVAGLAGFGAAGDPTIQQLQLAGVGRTGRGGVDATAGAASVIMQRAVAMDDRAVVATPDGGASFDEPLAEAVNNLGNAVVKAVQRK